MSRHLPIDQSAAQSVVKVLDPILLDLLELQVQTKTAHWNLRDANFIAVHELFDKVAEEVEDATDEIAERIRQLGQPVNAGSKRFSTENRLPDFPSGELDAKKAISALCVALQATIKGLREGIKETDSQLDEPITNDMLVNISEGFEKQLWFLDSHL